MRKRYIILSLLVVIAVAVLVVRSHQDSPMSETRQPINSTSKATKKTDDGFNKKQYSLTDPTSIWVVVNKHHPLNPKNYAPSDLVVPNIPLRVPGNASMQVRKVTATALEALFAGAKTNGTPLMLSSGYRSYDFQVSLYGGYVKTQGQTVADSESARPGYSEHQTGLASDVEPLDQSCHLEQCFADTPSGKWVAANAYKYGFIIRYAKGLTPVTGYTYEPWHVRYIGIPLATEMHNKNIATLEQYFDLGSAPDYN